MGETLHRNPTTSRMTSIARRRFLQSAVAVGAAGAIPLSSPSTAQVASPESFEESEPQCRVMVNPVQPAYPLDSILDDFMKLSEALTGIQPLDRNRSRQYLERYAGHPQLTSLLPPLIDAFRATAPKDRPANDTDISRMFDTYPTVRAAAQQLVYLWYVAAFFLPQDDKATKSVWVYGSPEDYEAALLWPLIRAHPPMTRGGPYGYWADAPSF
jgi:D-sorbitol dehydrogenase-like protein